MRWAGALFLLMAAPAAASPGAPWLVGDWFGQGQPYDRSEMWLAHMGGDGSLRVLFRACAKGKARDSLQTGTWTLTGDLETIQFQTVNGQFAPRQDLYQIMAHDPKSQTYKYLATGYVYRSTRVDAKFQMPECDLVS